MTSNDSDRERVPGSLRLGPGEFEMIFQVTKELRSLSGERLIEIGYGPTQVDYLLTALRVVRAHAEDVSIIQFDFNPGNIGEPLTTNPVLQSNVDPNDRPTVEVRMEIPWGIAADWYALANAIILALGERELFLRTGYSVDEVREAIRSLVRLSRG
jgi:hypothetical protein